MPDFTQVVQRPYDSISGATYPSDSGRSFPLGAAVLPGGVNFSVFSRRANRIELLLFDCQNAIQPTRVIELDARAHLTYHYWHVFVPGIRPGQVYGYRAVHPFDSDYGFHTDPGKVLLDPYGRAVVIPDGYSRRQARQLGMNDVVAMNNIVVDPEAYDWEGDAPLRGARFRAASRASCGSSRVGVMARHLARPARGHRRSRRSSHRQRRTIPCRAALCRGSLCASHSY
jgi:isoamylase